MKNYPGDDPTSFDYFHALYHNALENAMLLMNDEGYVTRVNKAFTKCFGYEEDQIRNKHFSLLFTQEDQANERPEQELQKVLKSGQAFDNNYLVSKDGTITWVSGESILITNDKGEREVLKLIQNIHRQKQSEFFLQEANQFNEDILKAIEDIVIVIDHHKNIVKANRAFLILFDLKDIDQQPLNFFDFIQPFDPFEDVQKSIRRTIATGQPCSNIPVEMETAQGDKRIFDVSCTAMDPHSEGGNILLVIHDITVHKKLEREREDIIGFVAHELRNPLANLVLCNELIGESLKEHNTDDIADMLQRSKNNITRLNKMISELYDATKINAGKLKLDMSTFDLREMIDEAIDTVQVLQPTYHITVSGNTNIRVTGDRHRLIQVVTNYLSNGIKYSTDKTDVTLTVQHDDTTLTVSVADEGPGISAKHLPYIFNRFFRAEKTKDLEGIGLGLYLCRQIIHAHKGKVWAESEEGKGSTFYFTIPIDASL